MVFFAGILTIGIAVLAMAQEKAKAQVNKLVLSFGGASVRPPLPGIDLQGIFHVRTVPDARHINEWIERGNPFLAGMYRYSGFQPVKPKTRAVVSGRRSGSVLNRSHDPGRTGRFALGDPLRPLVSRGSPPSGNFGCEIARLQPM